MDVSVGSESVYFSSSPSSSSPSSPFLWDLYTSFTESLFFCFLSSFRAMKTSILGLSWPLFKPQEQLTKGTMYHYM